MFFNSLLKRPPTSILNHIPEQCVECLSPDVVRMHLTRLDREGDIQRRYQCRACDENILVAHCEELRSPSDSDHAQRAAPTAIADTTPPLDDMSDHQHKIAALEEQLALIDQEIANSEQTADKQESALLRATLGVADLKNMDAVALKHTRLLTLLNELHRMHYSKELVLAETEFENDQLRSRLAAAQASSSETESMLRAEIERAKQVREEVLKENKDLKQSALSIENELTDVNELLAETRKGRDQAIREAKAQATESALEARELNSQINVMRSKLDQAQANAEHEQTRLLEKVLDLESQLARQINPQQSSSRNAIDQSVKLEKSAHFIDARSANTELDEQTEETGIIDECMTKSKVSRESNGTQFKANKKYRTGVKYIMGDGVASSEQAAVSYFEQASRLGHAAAQYNLGVLQYKGSQKVRDLKASVYWLAQAASEGHEKAASLLPEVEAAFEMYDQRNMAV